MKDKYATPDFLCSSCGSTGVFRPLGMEDYTHLEGHYLCKGCTREVPYHDEDFIRSPEGNTKTTAQDQIIRGYYGCKCHPYASWEEANKLANQKLKAGQMVRHRCNGEVGVVERVNENDKTFVLVKYFGTKRHPSGELEHVSLLEKTTANGEKISATVTPVQTIASSPAIEKEKSETNPKTIEYPGNKHTDGVWQRIINQLPPHDVFISGFLGTCKVMLEKKPARVNIGIESNYTERLIHFWSSAGLKDTAFYHERFLDFVTRSFTFSKQMNDRVLIYLDPPYMICERRSKEAIYEHEMSDEQHYELLQWCDTVTQTSDVMIAISHYPCKAYNELLNSGWRKVEYKTSTRGGTVTDALYMNYPEPAELHDYRFLGKDRIDRQRIKRKINGKVRQLLGLPQLERNAILQAMMNLSAHPPLEKNGKVS